MKIKDATAQTFSLEIVILDFILAEKKQIKYLMNKHFADR